MGDIIWKLSVMKFIFPARLEERSLENCGDWSVSAEDKLPQNVFKIN